jgi:hypothetical protein
LLSGCTPEKRLARLVENHPELAKTDTVFDTIKVVVPEVTADTVVRWATDTIVLQEDRLRVQVITDTITKTLKIKGQCLTDTVFQVVPKYITQISPVKHVKIRPWYWITAAAFGWILAAFLFLSRRGYV